MIKRAATALCALLLGAHAQAAECDWPAWRSWRDTLLRDGGRIVDVSDARQITTSEGQSYALFFALVANDRDAFKRLLTWTETRLAKGDLGSNLPAWLWGKQPDGGWGVLDGNSASDADLWIAYDLAEASRLWHEPRYTALSQLLAKRIMAGETADIPGLGLSLLPGAIGFAHDGEWRLNPSYLPLPVLKRFAALQPASAWPDLAQASIRLVGESAAHGYSPDWVRYIAGKGFAPDGDSHADGSYNAIRSYLWVGLAHADDPDRAALLKVFKPMATTTARRGTPPEHIDTATGTVGDNAGPTGFSAALEPFLRAAGEPAAADAQARRWQAVPPAPDAYYSQALSLFAHGALEGRYRFAPDGALIPAWPGCVPSLSR